MSAVHVLCVKYQFFGRFFDFATTAAELLPRASVVQEDIPFCRGVFGAVALAGTTIRPAAYIRQTQYIYLCMCAVSILSINPSDKPGRCGILVTTNTVKLFRVMPSPILVYLYYSQIDKRHIFPVCKFTMATIKLTGGQLTAFRCRYAHCATKGKLVRFMKTGIGVSGYQ